MIKKNKLLITLFIFTLMISFNSNATDTDYKPNIETLGEEVELKYLSQYQEGKSQALIDALNIAQSNLFDNKPVLDLVYTDLNVDWDWCGFGNNSEFYFEIPEEVNIWRSGVGTGGSEKEHYGDIIFYKLSSNNDWIDITSDYLNPATNITSTEWEKFASNLPAGIYKVIGNKNTSGNDRVDGEWYVERAGAVSPPVTDKNILCVETDLDNPVYGGDEFFVYATLKNVENIYAEDIHAMFDSDYFEFLEATPVKDTTKLFFRNETSNTLRYITADIGEGNGLSGNHRFLKLKFKALNKEGEGEIKFTSGLIANGIGEEFNTICEGLKISVIKNYGGDVNKDGRYSLGDLAISSRLFGSDSSNWDDFAPDIDLNGSVEEIDLTQIVKFILQN